MLNYHELTINEPRDSPARRKQFLVICTVMGSVLLHAAMSAGGFEAVRIESSSSSSVDGGGGDDDDDKSYFPGGEFIYKPLVRDYAATGGMFRSLAVDVGAVQNGGWGAGLGKGEGDGDMGGILYAIYLDADSDVDVGERRFLTGALLGCEEGCPVGEDSDHVRRALLEKNRHIDNVKTNDEWEMQVRSLPYEVGTIPRAHAAVARFPYTGGFVSALVHQFKVFPAMVKYARAHGAEGSSVVMSSTCSINQQMCTHYAMLDKVDDFFLGGRPNSLAYLAEVNAEKKNATGALGSAWKGVKKLLGLSGKKKQPSSGEKSDAASSSEEL